MPTSSVATTNGSPSLAFPAPRSPAKATDLPSDVVYTGREILGELGSAEAREYLLTNGIGGYASMTLAGSLTRSYHGLLVAALRPPLDRTLLLSKLNETVVYLSRSYHLATDRRKDFTHASARRRHSRNSAARRHGSDLGHDPSPVTTPTRVRAGACLNDSGAAPPAWKGHSRAATAHVHHDELISPLGFELLESFHLEGTVPTFVYSFADAILEKRLWMKHSHNTVYVTYHLRRAVQAVELRLKALVNHRNHHRRTDANHPNFNYSANVGPDGSSVSVLFTSQEHQETTLSMHVSRGRADLTNQWVPGFVLSEERARGLPHLDDNLHVATFIVELPPGGRLTFAATTESTAPNLDGDAELSLRFAYERSLLHKFYAARERTVKDRVEKSDRRASEDGVRSTYSQQSGSPNGHGVTFRRRNLEPCIKQLVLAADQFIISRGGGRSVVAGFHWFADWARDTMISLPGLTIATGRYDVARSILQTFAKYVSKGMLPNRFPDDGSAPTEEDYNTVDGTLWYFEAIRSYYVATSDMELLLGLFPILQDIITHHVEGTRFGIKEDSDGLLMAGVDGLALTWMDAKADEVYTARIGKGVELAALWYNALNCMAYFAGELDHESESDMYTTMADKTERSFQQKFWDDSAGYCYDVIDGGKSGKEKDSSLRPNQLIAASLNWSPLTEEQRYLVVEMCSQQLVTSHAIRTLSPDDEKYCGVYGGDVYSRDRAYHQGAAWAWLFGPFVLAHLRVHRDKELAREFLLPLLRSHLTDAGLGQISEIFDGDPPNRARGCIAQAWSVAEMLRAWLATDPDDVYYEE